MEPRISFITLGVSDLEASARFYREVLQLPQLPSPPGIVFFEMERTWLALYPRDSLAEDAGVPSDGRGFRGFTLSHNVKTEEEVDRLLHTATAGGGTLIKPAHKAEWGGRTGYFADPDGFLWEVAWNPKFPHV